VRIVARTGGFSPPDQAQTHFVEHLRAATLSCGTYSIPAGGTDDQQPHRQDEVYFVTAGRARLVASSGSADVRPGDLIFVPAGEEHRFVDVAEDLALLVVFAPPYSGRGEPAAVQHQHLVRSTESGGSM
jgi:mannose-6-phosphate isomerase-like protein (cupin superfamily)